MSNALDRNISFGSLIRFTLPTMSTMVFLSLYTIVDGIFISRIAGPNALSATNIVYPVVNIILGISIMFATGGSAIVAKAMGEGKNQEARKIFTALAIIVFLIGILILGIGILFIEPIIYAMGATKELYPFAFDYLIVILLFTPSSILKTFFDYFLVAAGKPQLGLLNSILGGVINITLDYIFMVPLGMGVKGAALATALGMLVPALISITFFSLRGASIYFEKPLFRLRTVLLTCGNGSSEMVTQLSSGITTYLYNITLLHYIGVDGVAAVTIVLYAQFLLVSIFLGFSSGAAPLVSFNYGSGNHERLRKLVTLGYRMIGAFSVLVFILAQIAAPVITAVFTDTHTTLYQVTLFGFRIYAISFLFNGFNVFSSGLFTALSNGKISAAISFLHSMGFFLPGIFFLPKLVGVTGVWLVVPIAEFLTVFFCYYFYRKNAKFYGYQKVH